MSQIKLDDEGRDHIDAVVLVGGASRMPILREKFEEVLPGRVIPVDAWVVDPVSVVALGLARRSGAGSLDLQYPNYQVVVQVRNSVTEADSELFEPFAPLFEIRGGQTSIYEHRVGVGVPHPTAVRLVFRRVGSSETSAFPWRGVSSATSVLALKLSLLGHVQLFADGQPLYDATERTPWTTDDGGIGLRPGCRGRPRRPTMVPSPCGT